MGWKKAGTLAVIIFSGTIQAQKYIFPLPIEPALSGAFTEYRGYQLHTGLDIRTLGLNNLPVLAVSGGSVRRLYGQPDTRARGYGTALYLQHRDGNQSVYGHLSGLSSLHEMDQAWKLFSLMSRTGSFSVIMPDGWLPVNQGDIIAFSGERGSGPSHLHYEVLDSQGRFINILGTDKSPRYDNSPPVIEDFQVLTRDLRMPGKKSSWQKSKTKRLNSSLYEVPDFAVDGTLSFKVTAYDLMNAKNRTAINGIRLMVDGRTLVEQKYTAINGDERYLTSVMYDTSQTNLYPGRYCYRLYDQRYGRSKTLPGWILRSENDGNLDTATWSEGSRHPFTVLVTDMQMNSSELRGTLIKGKGEKPPEYRETTNVKAGKSHVRSLKGIRVVTPVLKRDAFLTLEKTGTRPPAFLRAISPVFRIRWSGPGKITVTLSGAKRKSGAVYSAGGSPISAMNYSASAKGFTGTFSGSVSLVLADDISAPSFSYGNLYGPLEHDRLLLGVSDSGSGLDEDNTRVFFDGRELNAAEKREWGFFYDRDRRAFLFPTGIRPEKDRFPEGKIHSLGVKAVDHAGNASALWSGYILMRR